jgi:hypothetical protein
VNPTKKGYKCVFLVRCSEEKAEFLQKHKKNGIYNINRAIQSSNKKKKKMENTVYLDPELIAKKRDWRA